MLTDRADTASEIRWRPDPPLPEQREVLTARERFILYRGGLGSGKTWAGAIWMAGNVALHGPGSRHVIVSPTYGMSRDVVQAIIADLWPPSVVATYHGTRNSYTWPGGVEVLLRSADRPDRLRGIEVSSVWIDEPSECPSSLWPIITGRLRQSTRWSHQILLTGTPCGFDWVFDAFGDGDDIAEGCRIVTASSSANRANLPDGYLASLEGIYSSSLAAQELEGRIVSMEGLVLPFDAQRHALAFEVNRREPTWAGLDFGYRSPAVSFWQPYGDAWVCVGELNPSDISTEQLARRIVAEGYNLQRVWCDPAGKSMQSTSGRTDVDLLRRAGVPATYRTSTRFRRIAYGLEVMRAAMDPSDGSAPRFYLAEHVARSKDGRGLARSLLGYKFRGQSDTPEKDGVHDHAVDAARYFWANEVGTEAPARAVDTSQHHRKQSTTQRLRR